MATGKAALRGEVLYFAPYISTVSRGKQDEKSTGKCKLEFFADTKIYVPVPDTKETEEGVADTPDTLAAAAPVAAEGSVPNTKLVDALPSSAATTTTTSAPAAIKDAEDDEPILIPERFEPVDDFVPITPSKMQDVALVITPSSAASASTEEDVDSTDSSELPALAAIAVVMHRVNESAATASIFGEVDVDSKSEAPRAHQASSSYSSFDAVASAIVSSGSDVRSEEGSRESKISFSTSISTTAASAATTFATISSSSSDAEIQPVLSRKQLSQQKRAQRAALKAERRATRREQKRQAKLLHAAKR